nr:unnamed protein product [uncultured bacterium]
MLTCALSSPGRPVQPDCLCRTVFGRVRPPGQRPGPRKPLPPCGLVPQGRSAARCESVGMRPCTRRRQLAAHLFALRGHRPALCASGSCTAAARLFQASRRALRGKGCAIAQKSSQCKGKPKGPYRPLHWLLFRAGAFFPRLVLRGCGRPCKVVGGRSPPACAAAKHAPGVFGSGAA